MKKLYGDIVIREAEKIVKLEDKIIGYIGGSKDWELNRITDFTPFSLEAGQQWDLPEPTELQILGQIITDLELKILMLEAATNV